MNITQKTLIFMLRVYQTTISPDHGLLRKLGLKNTQRCVFYPTCSEYTVEAIERYGVTKGIAKGAKRVWRCRPNQTQHIDPLV